MWCQCLSSLILVSKILQVPLFRLLPQIHQIPKNLKKGQKTNLCSMFGFSYNVQFQKIIIHTPPTEGFFVLIPLLEFPFFLYPHQFRAPRKFQVVLYVENWQLTEVKSICFISLLCYLRFILLLIRKKIFPMFDFFQ